MVPCRSGVLENLEDARKTFLTEFVEKVALNDTPDELISNWDQTGAWCKMDDGQEGKEAGCDCRTTG